MSAASYRDFDLRRVPADSGQSAPRHAHHWNFFRRIFAAIERSLTRRAEREAGRFIASHGGRVTDDVERQLAEHFNGRGFLPYSSPRSANLTAR